MDCCNFPNIKITKGNNFSIILPLRSRTYVATKPIDEDIDPLQLENVVVTFGGVEYPAQKTAQGVQIDLPATLDAGTYNILLTADYLESNIHAAYESAVTIVPWSAQSTAEQYIVGSPIVLYAAYVLSGVMTDAELEALKAELRADILLAEQAKADADAAKAAYDAKAEAIDNMAQQTTLVQGVSNIREDISHIDIDTSDLAKQGANPNATLTDTQSAAEAAKTAAQANQSSIGTPAQGQPSTLFAAIEQSGQDSKQTIVDAINYMGGSATTDMTWAQLSRQIESLQLIGDEVVFDSSVPMPLDISSIYAQRLYANKILEIHHSTATSIPTGAFSGGLLTYAEFPIATGTNSIDVGTFGNRIRKLYLPKFSQVPIALRNIPSIQVLDLSGASSLYSPQNLTGCINLIDIVIGGAFVGSFNFSSTGYNPTNAYNSSSSNLCFDTDLEEYGQVFSNNFAKWKWCIINHFAANLQNRTGLTAYTITFGSTVLSHFDAEMIAAFTDKNWNLA